MAVTLHASGTQTATVTTEHSLSTATVAGVFQLEVDLSAMVAGDITELRAYKIVLAGGTKRLIFFEAFYGAQPANSVTKTSVPLSNELTDANSLELSLKQTFGTGRAYPWKVLKHA